MAAEPDVSSIVPPNDSPIRHRLSGRALARAPVGGGFPVSPFRLRGGFTLPPWTTFPAALPGSRVEDWRGTGRLPLAVSAVSSCVPV